VSTTGPGLASLSWPLRTERMSLRPITHDDVDAVLDYRSRDDVATYLSREALTRADVRGRVDRFAERGRPGHPEPGLGLVAELDRRVVADLSLRLEPDDNGMWLAVMGYAVHPDVAGRGLATELVRALVRLCFTDLHLVMVTADVFAPHRASQRVLEKAGFRVVAHVPSGSKGAGEPRLDDLVYAVTAAEWAAHVGATGG
jgi:RimJ/RimL family protein N-acetyltransferase